jgi:hypothetical protein
MPTEESCKGGSKRSEQACAGVERADRLELNRIQTTYDQQARESIETVRLAYARRVGAP